jgi:predicted anti-sigma-YlaC factor YlaD
MALSHEQIDRLLKKIQQTREVEMTCPECLDELDKYTQRILDGVPIDGVLVSVGEHLGACPCCTGQFNLVLDTLRSIEEL